MPGILVDSDLAAHHDGGSTSSRSSILQDDYPTFSIPGYTEKPLEDQLEPIAVVGMGCRLPGDVGSPAAFWDMMINKKTGNTPKVPPSRFNIDAHFHKNNDRPGSFGVLGGYFLDGDLNEFDPNLFNITPIEAMWMDPQQRKLLEVVYEALESGGIKLEDISGSRTAVFAASFTADWQQMSFKESSFRHSLAATGVDPGIISNRISHVFNLKGPSIVCNTACSSSVYALHNACNSLRNCEAEAAIVGGVNLIITVDQHMNTAKLGVLSPTSTCHTFDKSADGYGRAEAVGAVYLKRLSDAVRDGDPIRGVIRSSATNSNGRAPAVGITYPNRDGQADVIGHAYQRGGDLDPRLTGYFECHGTGTAIGDPIEVEAVSIAMNKKRQPGKDDPLWIGAVKTNIGHSEAASGLSALIKAILIVERGIIPPTRGVVEPNPQIKWRDWQVKVTTDPVPFPSHLPVRRVSINSFGYGGTNAHIIVEAADSLLKREQTYKYIDDVSPASSCSSSLSSSTSPSSPGSPRQRRLVAPRRVAQRKRPFLLPFSAHDRPTLLRNIAAYGGVVANYSLVDLSYTLATRRSVLSSKAFTVVRPVDFEGAFQDVTSSFTFAETKKAGSGSSNNNKDKPTMGFVFTGQGAQWARMGAELIAYSRVFRQAIRELDTALEELYDGPAWSIEDALLEPAETSVVGEAEFSQPLCTAVQIALVQLLESWGIRPAVTVGHSSGEMAAAYAAGLLSARETIVLAYYRGLVTRDVNTYGAMMAVGLGADEVAPYLNDADANVQDKVLVACVNSPASVTLSGDADAVERVRAKLVADGVFARIVKTNGKAYHSHHMAPVSAKYEALVQVAKRQIPFIKDAQRSYDASTGRTPAKMVSSVTNKIFSAETSTVLNETYWSQNLRSPVLFSQAVEIILTDEQFSDVDLFVEIGPHSAMKGPFQQIKKGLSNSKTQTKQTEYLSTLLRGADSAAQLLNLAGEMFLRGQPINMERVISEYADETETAKGSVIVDLPPYQWNYARPFWAENRASHEHRAPKYPRHDVLGERVLGASLAEPTWRNVLRMRDLPWLRDHALGGESVFPAAGYFAMAMEAVTQLNEQSGAPVPIDNYVLRDVSIQKALVTPDNDDGIEVLLNLRPSIHASSSSSDAFNKVTWWDFGVSSVDPDGTVKEHMVGSIAINARPQSSSTAIKQPPPSSQRASGQAWNQALREVGFDYGPTFQDMEDIRFDGKKYWAGCTTNIKQQVDESLGESRYPLHPASIDSALQLSIVAIHAGRTSAMQYGAIPIQVDEVTIWPTEKSPSKANAYAWCDQRGNRNFETGAQMTTTDGELVLEIASLRCVSYEAAVPQTGLSSSALAEAPYGEIAWDVDFGSLKAPVDIQALRSADLVKLALFKDPGLKVLHVLAGPTSINNVQQVLERNPRAQYTVAAMEDAAVENLRAALAEYPGVKVVTAQEASTTLSIGSVDILAIDRNTADDDTAVEVVKSVWHTLKPLGHGFIDHYSSELPKRTGLEEDFQVSAKSNTGTAITRRVGGLIALNGNGVTTNGAGKDSDHSAQLVFREQPAELVSLVRNALTALGWSLEVVRLNSFANIDASINKHIIILADLERPLLYTLTETEFTSIHKITQTASSLLWVTAGGLLEGKRPEFALVPGLVRTVSSEQASLDFRTIDLDLETVALDQAATTIVQIAQEQQSPPRGDSEPVIVEREYTLSGGKRYISRLVRNNELNGLYAPNDSESSKRPFVPGVDRIEGQVSGGKIVFHETSPSATTNKIPLEAGQVEVRVQASGLTKEGHLVVSGSDYPTTFSHEIGGVVSAVGPGVTDLQKGDKVVGLQAGTYANYQRVPASLLHKLDQDGDDLHAVVSVLASYVTALYGLVNVAGLQPNEKVLVLSGAGATGVAAIRVVQNKGAIPYVVAESAQETEFLVHTLQLNASQVLATPLAAEQIRTITDGRGADVVFAVGGNNNDLVSAREAWRSIARFGRFVHAGRKDVLRRTALDGVPVQKGASYLPLDLLALLADRPQVVAGLLPTIVSLLRQGLIEAPGPLEIVGLAEINKAVAGFSDVLGAPKFVVQYDDDYASSAQSPPLLIQPARPRPEFSPDATYLLVGCLGGLGRSLTSWMMESGARRFVFLARSGADAPSAAKLIKDIETAGAIVTIVRGDVTSREDVSRAVREVPAEHPIKGVVHAAMVLRDGLFQSMTFSDWQATIKPKVLGAANLDAVLAGTPLDFFLMTSSVSGALGNPAQANYAAANSYLDSLARHRRRCLPGDNKQQTAVSLVLPMVLEVGVVAENAALEQSLKRKGMYGIDEEHLLQSFEAAIVVSPSEGGSTTPTDHIVVGLDPAQLQKAVRDSAVTDSFWLEDARLGHAIHDINASSSDSEGSTAAGGGGQSIIATIKAATSPGEAVEAVTTHFIAKLARMVLLDETDFEAHGRSIASYGIDSMVGAELRKWIFKEYKLDIPFQQLLSATLTIHKFAGQVCAAQGVAIEQ